MVCDYHQHQITSYLVDVTLAVVNHDTSSIYEHEPYNYSQY